MEPETQIQTEDNRGSQSVGGFLWELVKIFILALIIIVPLRVLLAEPFIVSGSSMVPNFHNKDYLIVDKLAYRLHPPQRGDVIIFKYPKDTSQYFIKRIIGLPGEKVQVDQGHVVIYNKDHADGVVLDEPYLPNQSVTFGRNDVISLGSDEYFVLGDNRLASSDSRVWGILPKNDIVGKAWLRVFPLDQAGRIPSVSYSNVTK